MPAHFPEFLFGSKTGHYEVQPTTIVRKHIAASMKLVRTTGIRLVVFGPHSCGCNYAVKSTVLSRTQESLVLPGTSDAVPRGLSCTRRWRTPIKVLAHGRLTVDALSGGASNGH